MNNTEKKLDALIDALGFDVEQVSKVYINGVMYCESVSLMPVTPMDNIVHPIYYKLTKRDIDCTGVSFDSNEDERDYLFMKEIKTLIIKSGIPKSVIHDLIDGIIHE
jgi:hypothetical protein